MDAKLDVLGKLFVELLEAVLVLTDFVNQLQTLLDQILSDDLQDLVLLKHLARNVEWQIFRVDYTLDKVEIIWNELFAVVHDEDSADVQLDVVFCLLVLKQVKGSTLGHEKESAELKLSFNREVFNGQVVFPVIGQGLVELAILFLGDVIGISSPDWLGLVQFLIL